VAGTDNLPQSLPHLSLYTVEKIHTHPDYMTDAKFTKMMYNFAILELKGPGIDVTSYKSKARILCLPEPNGKKLELQDYPEGSKFEVSGWGNDGSIAPKLQSLMINMHPSEECEKIWKAELTSTEFCAGSPIQKEVRLENGQGGICQRDGGGPLTYKDASTNEIRLLGVASWIPPEKGSCSGQKPGRFSDVKAALSWISEITGIKPNAEPVLVRSSGFDLTFGPPPDNGSPHGGGARGMDLTYPYGPPPDYGNPPGGDARAMDLTWMDPWAMDPYGPPPDYGNPPGGDARGMGLTYPYGPPPDYAGYPHSGDTRAMDLTYPYGPPPDYGGYPHSGDARGMDPTYPYGPPPNYGNPDGGLARGMDLNFGQPGSSRSKLTTKSLKKRSGLKIQNKEKKSGQTKFTKRFHARRHRKN